MQTIPDDTPITEKKSEPEVSAKYFISEVLLTAGPRKNFSKFASDADVDLGEDVAGLVSMRDQTYFWVLDGTSDSAIIKIGGKELFSSRLFAQAIAMQLQHDCIKTPFTNSRDWLLNAITQVKADWTQQFSELSEELRKEITDKYKLETFDISTTILAGRYDLAGNLDVARIGDSKLISFDAEGQPLQNILSAKPNLANYSRQFARLIFHPNKVDFSMSENYDKIENTQSLGVQHLFVFSDGLSTTTENYLKMNMARIPESIRTHLDKIPQRTEDDKALIIIQIRS